MVKAVPGELGSAYDYTKLGLNVSDWGSIAPFGSVYWSVFAGKTFGTAPYMFLNIAPGNEIYYYNKYAFNLMNRYEYINDKYAGFIFEHNVGNGIFKLPALRALKFWQFWNVKMLVGSLTDVNKALNFVGGHPFSSLDGKPYMEIGTGIDNILKFFRMDLVWRILPQPLPAAGYQRFGVFGSFSRRDLPGRGASPRSRGNRMTAGASTNPILASENRLKLGLFGLNVSGGCSLVDRPETLRITWDETVRVGQLADRIGFDAIIPVARWKGMGGRVNFNHRNFETFTWAAGLSAVTRHSAIFATFHVPTVHPVRAAKEVATIDHISRGRFGLNIVAGWNYKEIGMFGIDQRDHICCL